MLSQVEAPIKVDHSITQTSKSNCKSVAATRIIKSNAVLTSEESIKPLPMQAVPYTNVLSNQMMF